MQQIVVTSDMNAADPSDAKAEAEQVMMYHLPETLAHVVAGSGLHHVVQVGACVVPGGREGITDLTLTERGDDDSD